MDYLDILNGKYYQTYDGSYYKRLPRAGEQTEAPIAFSYEHIDPTEWRYKQLLQGLNETAAATASIKTRENHDYQVGKWVVLQDGKLYTILSCSLDMNAASREAARLLQIPIGAEYILRLAERENPWGLR